ncbi:MAG: MBL fold metallo-hydrolase [Clostridia bacterium]|nr:MBL fold metallo-hydrolase [Clostridia bacterium]
MSRSKKTSRRIKEKIISSIIGMIIIIVLSLLGYNLNITNQNNETIGINTQNNNNTNINESQKETQTNVDIVSKNNLKVYFIDVGQADSILITQKNQSMLIDAGNNEDGPDVVSFIKEKGISKLDYVVGTHPHEDHIGGLDDVINSDIQIENILMPKIQTNTKTFEDVLDAISNKELKVTAPNKGEMFDLGEANFEIMTDSILDEKNLNLSSITIRITFGNNSFLFMGDSEIKNEKTREWPKSDVLKVGHHRVKYK